MTNRGLRKYGDSFKRQVVSEILEGKYKSPCEASRAYGIKGRETVKNWCILLGYEHLLKQQIIIKTMDEQDELKAAKKEIKQLKAALSDVYIDKMLGDSFLKIACNRMDTDVDSFKKKHALRLCDLPQERGLKWSEK